MNKKLIGIVGVFLIIVIVIICILVLKYRTDANATGSFNKMSWVIDGYLVEINSENRGHPSGDSFFFTDFDIIDDENNKTYYFVDFIDDVKLSSESNELNDNILGIEEIEINGKKYTYDLDDTNTKATLYYQLPDGKGQFIIEVTGSQTFDSEGNLREEVPVVNREVLESKELAGILNISISKIEE